MLLVLLLDILEFEPLFILRPLLDLFDFEFVFNLLLDFKEEEVFRFYLFIFIELGFGLHFSALDAFDLFLRYVLDYFVISRRALEE